ncbi:hypothetical protein EG68_05229 [Paragonimus skrjabini miyazakii]|uniref:VWFA domain-containing protein n=1 Tax=Paragonimus skrjabini miyazakii TaxID=59628 RepID=A0A8S9YW50_9TREM|nr:hypothetical protein EG68_05229 [Paragonimus skrjabini miyazakii]
MAGQPIPRLHLVAYDCRNPAVNQFLAQLANIRTENVYHCFAANTDASSYTSDEVARLVQEIQQSQHILNVVRQVRLRTENSQHLADKAVNGALELVDATTKPPTHHLPQPPDLNLLHGPLNLGVIRVADGKQKSKRLSPCTSREWIERQGLRARKLGLFEVLAPNAYSQVTGYIPSIGRSVKAHIHEQCMTQMRWPDGTVKNVHVDLAELFEYQKQLRDVVSLFEKRVQWLTKESRGYFGTIVEPNVVILVDLSGQNSVYLVHIHYCLRHVLEQQVSQKSTFNLVAFGSNLQAFRPQRIQVNEKNLQAAWDWIRELPCSGSRNVLAAIRFALENETTRDLNEDSFGLYLFTSGVPDQDGDIIVSYLQDQRCCCPNLRLHVALYNVDDYDKYTGGAIPGRYANITKTADVLRTISHCTGGRFHWFRETGIIESDDIRELLEEINTIVEYSNQCQTLVRSLKGYPTEWDTDDRKTKCKSESALDSIVQSKAKSIKPMETINPRLNALTTSRQLASRVKQYKAASSVSPKAMAWERGVSNTGGRGDPMDSGLRINNKTHQNPRKPVSGQRKLCLFAGRCAIPKDEEILSSRDWLQKYSTRNLGLNLNQLVSGAACKHTMAYHNPIKAHVEARYCVGLFPLVNISGGLRHLQYTWGELEVFRQELIKLLRRYIVRFQWLLSGSRRYFGLITERCVVILLDMSGSMISRLDELKTQLKQLVWEQLFREANTFLCKLSKLTNGRRHTIPADMHCFRFVERLRVRYLETMGVEELTIKLDPSELVCTIDTHSDDLQMLIREMRIVERNLLKLEYFQHVYKDTKWSTEQNNC